MNLIERERSIIVAADVPTLADLENLVRQTCEIEGIGGYKVGLELVIRNGLPVVVQGVRKHTEKPIIYDHQKGGTDIPELGKKFANACREAGVDAVILFPFSGVKTEIDWIKVCQGEGLVVLVGAHMTHEKFLEKEGGFIVDAAPQKIFKIAAENGVRDFVVPGNKPEYVQRYKEFLETLLGEGSFTLYAPGFIAQGGEISETGKVAGRRWHAIVGRAIYEAENIKQAAKKLTKQLE